MINPSSDQTFFGLLGLVVGGGRLIQPPPLNFDNIEATTMKLGGQIVHPKMFPLRSTT